MRHQEDIDFLEHYGKKGMQWGVRRDRRVESLARVGRGEGSKVDKAKAVFKVGAGDVIRGKGIAGAAKIKSDKQRSRNARVRAGEGSALDILKYAGGTKYSDLIPTKTK